MVSIYYNGGPKCFKTCILNVRLKKGRYLHSFSPAELAPLMALVRRLFCTGILGEELQFRNLIPIRVVDKIGRKAKHFGLYKSCDLCYIQFLKEWKKVTFSYKYPTMGALG